MESDWDWKKIKRIKGKIKIGGEKNEIWRIWWTICTTRIKEKFK